MIVENPEKMLKMMVEMSINFSISCLRYQLFSIFVLL